MVRPLFFPGGDIGTLAINGAVNPLAPMAFVDLKAKAHGVELTGLTPYSAKYTGYPIVKGTLTVDVHYLLDQGQLTADNRSRCSRMRAAKSPSMSPSAARCRIPSSV